MRLHEFEQLSEASEYLDRSKYGAWIDTKANEIIPVKNHGDYLKKRYREHIQSTEELDIAALFYRAFNDGLVRVLHEHEFMIDIEGKSNSIKKAWKFIRPTAMKSKDIYIAIPHGGGEHQFNLPTDRIKLIRFVNNL